MILRFAVSSFLKIYGIVKRDPISICRFWQLLQNRKLTCNVCCDLLYYVCKSNQRRIVMRQITLLLPVELIEGFKAKCKENHTSMRAEIMNFMKRYVGGNENE